MNMNSHHLGGITDDDSAVSPGRNAETRPGRRSRSRREAAGPPDDAPTRLDVLNGRGPNVQNHEGNMTYRTLVFLNREIYNRCPRHDKIKMSRSIVAAVREMGGRFLELDKRSGTYHDIGDREAVRKTSQALREARGRRGSWQRRYCEMMSDDTASLAESLSTCSEKRVISSDEESSSFDPREEFPEEASSTDPWEFALGSGPAQTPEFGSLLGCEDLATHPVEIIPDEAQFRV